MGTSNISNRGGGLSRPSDGNRVNVGNFDVKGLNVNNWNDDNRNDNIGLSAARQSALSKETPTDKSGSFC
jgi:hypothetical protein